MKQNEEGKVVGAIPSASDDRPTAEMATTTGDAEVSAELTAEHPAPESPIDPLLAAEQADTEAVREVVTQARDGLIRTLTKVANWIRLTICNALGITYAMRQLNLRVHGNRADIEHLANTQGNNAQILKRLVDQTNANTRLINAWKHGYPILAKIAAEQAAREAKAAQKVISNGKVASAIVGADGKPLERSREEALLEEVQRNFAMVMAPGSGPTAKLYLEELVVDPDGTIHTIDDLDAKSPVQVMFRGAALTIDEVRLVKAEQRRLLEAQSK